jgi:endonuclease YncB( thermonuclease family)
MKKTTRNPSLLVLAAIVALGGGSALLRPDLLSFLHRQIAPERSADPGLPAPGADGKRNWAARSCCRAVDGDTLRCGSERIRLLGIDAPEMPGHCHGSRVCAPGDPFASQRHLAAALDGNLTIHRMGTDRYGRTLATVSGPAGDLSCGQLKAGLAIYKPRWDNQHRVASLCPEQAQDTL